MSQSVKDNKKIYSGRVGQPAICMLIRLND